ncbi:MAG: TRAP transporter substrate-binding protein DctP [Alphaproteobacteria bacterium]|nr:TRAP transporter substrate-binding protein DctP [Alphaproteobacteria bacterium]
MKVKTTLAAVLAAGAFAWGAAPAAAQAPVEGPRVSWNFSVWGPPRPFTAGVQALADHLSARSGGKFTVKIHYGGALSAGPDNLDNIKLGAFEMAAVCTSYHPGKNPGMSVLDLPFLPLADKNVHWKVHMALHKHPYIVEEFKRWNAVLIKSVLQPQSELMGKGKAIESVADFNGRRIRALGGTGEAIRRLGGVPTTMQATEVYNALERGIIEVVAFPYTYAFAAYKINEISAWYTTNLAPGANNCPTVANLTAYNKLPPQYKELMEEAKDVAFNALKAAQTKAEARDLAAWRAAGMKEITFTPETLEKIQTAGGKPVWDAWVKNSEAKGVPAKELLQFVLDKAKEFSKN